MMNTAPPDPQREARLEQALLERRQRSSPPLASGAPPTLSAAQQRLWLHQTAESPGALYNMPCALRLRGAVDIEALRRALEHHVQRHASLRTLIEEHDGQPRARCCEVPHMDLPVLEMADEAQALDWLRGEADTPLSLHQAPLLRAHLLRLDSRHHLLSLTVHHIACDGWSMAVMLREIGQAYEAFSQGLPSPLPVLTAQYADYAHWQRLWLSEARVQTQLAFWQQHLHGAPALLSLPLTQARPARQRYHGSTSRFVLDAALGERLRAFCRRRGATPYMVLLAVFNVLLSRYCSSDDIVVGSPVANRFPQQTEALVGFFVNTLVMRNQPQPALSFEAFLQQVKQHALAAYAHQDVPFDRVVHALQPERSPSHSPLFQVEFVLQQGLPQRFALGKATVEPLPRDSHYTKFDLTLAMTDAPEHFTGQIEYSSALFDDGFGPRLAGHFQCLLASALATPEQPLATLSMLGAEEQATLQRWGTSPLAPRPDKHLLTYLAECVATQPSAVALEHGAQQLSYLQLEQLSNRIAHALNAAGVGQGERIALFMARGSLYLAAMLASFKVGALFVPFDPSQPAERNASLLQGSQPALILSDPQSAPRLAVLPVPAASLQLSDEHLARQPDDWHGDDAGRLEQTAYMIFTSGSTGAPKAAMVSHRGMLNHLLAKVHDLKLRRDDCIAQIAVQTFDVAIWQFFAALLVGARTRVLSEAQAWQPEPLLTQLQACAISVVETVPSHLELLLDEVARDPARYPLTGLRWMISNGEPLPTALARRWFAAFPGSALMNAYGPSECSDDVSHLCLREAPSDEQPYLPIGRPIGNARIHVLDAQLHPVPVGIAGEIHIGGLCVGQGYFQDPQRSAERFIDDPFEHRPGERLYKTGDLGRYRADGTLDLLGRCDFQLKIRGCRIEAGEVEAVLNRYPGLAQSLVLGCADADGHTRLVAYGVAPQRPAPSPSQLRDYCRQHLPDYMVPSAICLLDALPLLSNGKIDRAALPPLASFDPGSDVPYRAPRCDRERRLTEIWALLLGVPRVGIDDSFFQLGGHSLLAVELTRRCRAVLGAQLSLAQLFARPTIAGLVEHASGIDQEAV